MEVPEWRIISDELWDQAQARDAEFAARVGLGPRRPHPLTGALTCGGCGTQLAVRERGTYSCPTRQADRSRCPVSVRAPVRWAAAALPAALPCLLRADAPTWRARLKARRAGEQRRRQALASRLEAERLKASRLLAALEKGVHSPSLHERIRDRDAEIARLENELQEPPRFPDTVSDSYPQRLDEHVQALVAVVADSTEWERNSALRALAALTERCTIHPPDKRGGEPRLEIVPDFGACLALATTVLDGSSAAGLHTSRGS